MNCKGMRRFTILVAIGLLSGGGSAIAQTTWGELSDKGGKELSAEEAKQELGGGKMRAQTQSGIWYEVRYNADGSMDGWLESPRGRATLLGKWTTNEKNQYCWDYTISQVGNRVTGCNRLFKHGSDYYVWKSGQGRDAVLVKADFSK